MKRNTNARKLKNEKYSTGVSHCTSLEGSFSSLNFRFVGNVIPALALAFGLSLSSVNTPVLADDIKKLGQEIKNLKGKIQELENKYKSILEQSSATEGTKASKPAASAISVGHVIHSELSLKKVVGPKSFATRIQMMGSGL